MDRSSSSASSLARRTKQHLPLVKCPCCRIRTVKVFTLQTKDNPGIDFYKCPNHQVGNVACNFWKWEKAYKKYLESVGIPIRYVNPVEDAAKSPIVEASIVQTKQWEGNSHGNNGSGGNMGGTEGHNRRGKAATISCQHEIEPRVKLIQLVDVIKDIRMLAICILFVEIIRVI